MNTKVELNALKKLNSKNEKFESELNNEDREEIKESMPKNRGEVQIEKVSHGEKVTVSYINLGQTGDDQDKLDIEDRIEYKDISKEKKTLEEQNPEIKSGHTGKKKKKIKKNRGAPGCNIIETEPLEGLKRENGDEMVKESFKVDFKKKNVVKKNSGGKNSGLKTKVVVGKKKVEKKKTIGINKKQVLKKKNIEKKKIIGINKKQVEKKKSVLGNKKKVLKKKVVGVTNKKISGFEGKNKVVKKGEVKPKVTKKKIRISLLDYKKDKVKTDKLNQNKKIPSKIIYLKSGKKFTKPQVKKLNIDGKAKLKDLKLYKGK